MSDIARRTVAEKSVVSYLDLADQQLGEYLLVVEVSPVQTMLMAVDGVKVKDKHATGYLGLWSRTPVVTFSTLYPWYLMPRSYVDVQSYEDVSARRAEDDKILELMHKKYHPEPEAGPRTPIGTYL